MLEIALLNRRYGQNDQHVRRTEFVINHRTVADKGAEPQITFDQWRKRAQCRLRIDRFFRHSVHLYVAFWQSRCAPWLRRGGVVMKERQRKRQLFRISAIETCASEHHIAMVLQNVCVDAVPEEFDGTLVTVGRK